jgi:hypothetical protein
MVKNKQKKRIAGRFEVGSHGACEALLYEFRARTAPQVSAFSDKDPTDQPEQNIVRIVAATFDEAFAYLRWDRPEFLIESMKNLGLVVMVSGSRLD